MANANLLPGSDQSQPMSLLTVDRSNYNNNKMLSADRKADLLTLRIIEASERKMQLIKQLLSPEEFSSLQTELANRNIIDQETGKLSLGDQWKNDYAAATTTSDVQQTKSVPLELAGLQSTNRDVRSPSKRLSQSVANIRVQSVEDQTIEEKIRQNLLKKKEAVDFFFSPENGCRPIGADDANKELAIELRNGHYLSSSTNTAELEAKLLRQSSSDCRLVGLLSMFGLNRWLNPIRGDCLRTGEETTRTSEQEEEDKFVSGFVAESPASECPFNQRQNLLTLRRRLKADNQLDKIDKPLASRPPASRRSTRDRRLQQFHACENLSQVKAAWNERPREVYARQVDGTCSIPSERFATNLKVDELLLLRHPLFDLFKQISAPKLKKVPECDPSNKLTLELKLVELNFLETEVMLPSEKLTARLLDLYDRHEELLGNLTKLRSSLIGSLRSLDSDSSSDIVKSTLRWWLRKLDKLQRMQRGLSSGLNELESMQKENPTSSSPVQLKLVETTEILQQGDGIASDLMDMLVEKWGFDSGGLDKLINWNESNRIFELKENANYDKKRRQTIWDSLRSRSTLKLTIDEKYHEKYPLTRQQISPRGFLSVDFREESVKVPLALTTSEFVVIKCELVAGRQFPQMTKRVAASGSTRIRVGHLKERHSDLEMLDDNQREVCRLKIRYCTENKASKQEQLVEFLHKKMFKSDENLSTRAKLGQLLNRVDPNLLAAFLSVSERGQQLVVDPFSDKLEESGSDKLRRSLLAWRWTNQLRLNPMDVKQVPRIYLSDRDNETAFKVSQIENQTTKLSKQMEHSLDKSLASMSSLTGFPLIERIRSDAGDYLKNYELLLREKLRLHSTAEASSDPSDSAAGRPLLIEPKLDLVYRWPRIVFNVRKFLPRPRQARRPLMPQRRRQRPPTGSSMRLAEIISKELMLPPPTTTAETTNEDLESRVVSHWHRFASQRAAETSRQTGDAQARVMQLLVTIQQAQNLPMRCVFQAPQATRPSSPIFPTASARNSPFQLQQQQQQPILQLQQPTSYVELVFQQKQLATSLAQGKNPSWNETLFFAIDEQQQSSCGQLVDEYLELNLYDYFLSLVPAESFAADSSTDSTLLMVSQPLARSSTPLARQQQSTRLERHLLGSLRVPLSTLLHSGRIEGQFCLSQPLFLDQHQFTTDDPPPSQEAAGFQLARPNATYMSLFITLDPPPVSPIASPPVNFYLPTGSYESDRLFEYAKLWEQTLSRLWSYSSSPRKSVANKTGNSRHVRALVLQREAKYCLICRLLGPLKPPGELVARGESVALIRFVSLFRPVKHEFLHNANERFPLMRSLSSGIWFDAKQLVQQWLGSGAGEEQAVLLCNYLLYLGHCSALLLGDSIPDGRCVYVIVWREQVQFSSSEDELNQQLTEPLTRENFVSRLPIVLTWRSVQLIDASKGKTYQLGDRSLPLTSVGSIVTLENVYANIQPKESPWPVTEISFDIRVRTNWLPLFCASSSDSVARLLTSGKNNHRKWLAQLATRLDSMRRLVGVPEFTPLQANPLALEPEYQLVFSADECRQLEAQLERSIKSHLLKWRPNRPTYFNRTLSRLLADKLATFEDDLGALDDWRLKLADFIRGEILLSIESTAAAAASNRQVYSWPVNVAFSALKSLLNSLFASGVHAADMTTQIGLDADECWPSASNSTQFLVACHVRPYPARLLSVWLYVGAIVVTTNKQRLLPA